MARIGCPAPAPRLAQIADVVHRLAVLLKAGVEPRAAWRFVAASSPDAREPARRIGAGESVTAALAEAGVPWREVAAAWRVATAVGAPLGDTLRAFAEGLRDAADARDDVSVALAEPASTARLMGWLPAVGVVLGMALGFDTAGVLLTDPRGWACIVLGALLLIAGRAWSAALVRRAQPDPGLPGLEAELYAIALGGGVSLDRAAAHVSAAISSQPSHRTVGGEAPQTVPRAVREVLDLSRAAGVPAVELLRAESTRARHGARIEGRSRAARLGSRLLLPLGVCTLPSFLVLGVAPLVLAVLSTTDLPFG
ncbi:type II secretion system F family protein [Microbacterium sp. LRZ72]|uniref:type II secretion system F family protein n=1 Tax=Microbacterium sp. LRZ72 TaxID=2942481 RepID=UPI0029BA83C4|nr:type II secretion system F family protein [Microbacterium sp. LRZ72]MDX2376904.1 type II secretion system F family protein [Microbacterium sp. LRZ72]